MRNWKSILVKDGTTLLDTMKIIDESALQFAVVVNSRNQLLGTVTDGDIRRGILAGYNLHASINDIMNKAPFAALNGNSSSYYKNLMKKRKLKQLPIVDEFNIIVDLKFLDNNWMEPKDNVVILMVGGLGTRLRPLTNDIPKPMLKVGGKPILETIIEGFKSYGYTNFILSVNYKKEVIQDYFQNGEMFGVNIDYLEETKRMGTAGALSLLNSKPNNPFFVMNGDLLTQVNFQQLMNFHIEQKALATMCVREYEYEIPYGVIETTESRLVSIKEKPVHKSFVNAGIYVLSPEVFEIIPKNEFYDMPDLFQSIIDKKGDASIFPIREYWLDIGKLADYEKANNEYREKIR